MDARVPVAGLLAAFGVPATVTRPAPDDAPIPTTGIWVTGAGDEGQPYGTDFRRTDPRRQLAFLRSALETLPRGTEITAPEVLGGTVKTWRVDQIGDATDSEFWRAVVVPQPSS